MEAYVLADLWIFDTFISLSMQLFQVGIYAADGVLVGCLPDFWAAFVHGWAVSSSLCPFRLFLWYVWF